MNCCVINSVHIKHLQKHLSEKYVQNDPKRGMFYNINVWLVNFKVLQNQMHMKASPICPAVGECLLGHGKSSSHLLEDNGRMKD